MKSEIDFPIDSRPTKDEIYAKAKDNLSSLIQQGILIQSPVPSFYLYEQTMGSHSQTGIVAAASVEEYDTGLIKKHEHTRPDKETDRALHVDTVNANTGPVFLTYKDQKEIRDVISTFKKRLPYVEFRAEDGIGHRLWTVELPEDVATLSRLFLDVPALYVADGHHRSAAASRVKAQRQAANPTHNGHEGYNTFLSVIFPDSQLKILDYNRVVRDLNGLTLEALLSKLGEKFEIDSRSIHTTDEAKPTQRHDFSLYCDGRWIHLRLKPAFIPNDPVASLDVSLLQDLVLKPLLGIENPRTDERIDFVGGIRGMKELEKRCKSDMKIAFALYPTGIDQLMSIADSGHVMPPKSTWFEPKLRSGMVVKSLAN